MSDSMQIVNFVMELWGSFLSFVMLISVFLKRKFDRKASRYISIVIFCCALLLLSDAFARFLRGNNVLPWYGTAINAAQYLVFVFLFLSFSFTAQYINYIMYKRIPDLGKILWTQVDWIISAAGILLVTINLFHPYIYTFDSNNNYQRLYFGKLPGIILLMGFVSCFSIVTTYIKRLEKYERLALLSYALLPIIYTILQMFLPQFQFGYLTSIICLFILYISYEVEYHKYNLKKEREAAEERMRLYSRQIQPHFIFNTLSVIKYLCGSSPKEAEETIDELASYLRSSSDFMTSESPVSIELELDFVISYISLQRKRFGDKISYTLDIKDKNFDIPPFTLQTIVENSIKHGIKTQPGKNLKISISTYTENQLHYVKIDDNGAGFDTAVLNDSKFWKNHLGIKNTKERLELMCDGQMKIESGFEKGTSVIISVPL